MDRGFRLQRHWIITFVICFVLNFLGILSPWPFPASIYWRNGIQNGISRDRKTEGQKGGTERWDKRAFLRDRMTKGQKGGTERLGQKGRDRTSRITAIAIRVQMNEE